MARLPKFLNVSLLRRMRLELPAAKVVLIAFSATLAVVGVGAFVATLPTLTAGVAPVALRARMSLWPRVPSLTRLLPRRPRRTPLP